MKIQDKLQNLLILCIFPPFFSMIYFLKKFYENPKKNSLLLAISLSSIFCLIIPMYDIIHFYNSYIFIKTLSLREFFFINKTFYHYIYWLGSVFLEYWHIYFIIISFILFVWNSIFIEMINLKNSCYKYFFIIFLFSIYPREILDLTRYFLAIIVYLYFMVKFFKNRNTIFLFAIFISFFIHHSLIIFIILFYVSVFLEKFNPKLVNIVFISFILIGIKIFEKKILIFTAFSLKKISNPLSERITNYTINNNKLLNILKESRAESFKFFWIILILIILGFFILYLLSKKYILVSFLDYLLLETLILNFFFIDKYVLNERIYIFFVILLIIWIIAKPIVNKKYLKIFGIIIFLNTSFFTLYYIPAFYVKENVTHLSNVKTAKLEIYKSFYMPTFLTVFRTKYSDSWIEKWRVK